MCTFQNCLYPLETGQAIGQDPDKVYISTNKAQSYMYLGEVRIILHNILSYCFLNFILYSFNIKINSEFGFYKIKHLLRLVIICQFSRFLVMYFSILLTIMY